MKIYTLLMAAGLLAACNNSPKSSTDPKAAEKQNEQKLNTNQAEKDAEFLVKVADGNMLEIEMGKLASTHGKSAAVINFGNMMVEHHGKMLAVFNKLVDLRTRWLPVYKVPFLKSRVPFISKVLLSVTLPAEARSITSEFTILVTPGML